MQNKSHAVMSQRIEPHDSLDDFPTPPWATRALCEHVIHINGDTVWEPAAGRGHMAETLSEYANSVWASDVHDYESVQVHDFLQPYRPSSVPEFVDWIITNPPFRLATQFVLRAMELKPRQGIAMLVRTVFIESVGRYIALFKKHPPMYVAQFSERVPMLKGRLEKDATTATAYCWIVWKPRYWTDCHGTKLLWIPPCRKVLEKESDYAS